MEGAKTELADDIRALVAKGDTSSFGKVHALWTLAELKALDKETVQAAISDSDWFVQMTGLRLAGRNHRKSRPVSG